jgi:hypothetical protein
MSSGFKDHKPSARPKWLPAAVAALALGAVAVFLVVSSSSGSTTGNAAAAGGSINAAPAPRVLAPEPVFEPEEDVGEEEPVEDPEDVEVEEVAEVPSPSPKPDTPLVETHVKCFQSAEYDEICTYDLLCFDGDKVRLLGESCRWNRWVWGFPTPCAPCPHPPVHCAPRDHDTARPLSGPLEGIS